MKILNAIATLTFVPVLAVFAIAPATAAENEVPDAHPGYVRITNVDTGLFVDVSVTSDSPRAARQLFSEGPTKSQGSVTADITWDNLMAIGVVDQSDVDRLVREAEAESSVVPFDTGSQSRTKHPLTMKAGLEYLTKIDPKHKVEKIKVQRAFGSTSCAYACTITGRTFVVRDGAQSNVMKKYPTTSSFSYSTSWGWVDRMPSTWGAYANFSLSFAPSGMAKSDLSVIYYAS